VALLAAAAYAVRDRLKEIGRSWLRGKMYRFHAQRVSRLRVPARRSLGREVIVRAREWCNETTRATPDRLNPEAGASMQTTLIEYLHRGVMASSTLLREVGASRVRHVFLYDLSPLFPRLHDAVKRVPVVEPDDHVHFVDAPRRYRVPLRVRVSHAGQHYEERAVVVLDKHGLRRLERPRAQESGDALGALE
jgi:hypothetical protein